MLTTKKTTHEARDAASTRRPAKGRAIAHLLVLATLLGATGDAMAHTGSHRDQGRQAAHRHDANGPSTLRRFESNTGSGSIGSWHYRPPSGDCDPTYPAHEQTPCGTATGGPVGGLGS